MRWPLIASAVFAVQLGWIARTAAASGPIEYALVPLAGGDTDIGFGGGLLASVARIDPDVKPFVWRLEGTTFVTFKRGPDGVTSPYQDAFLLFTLANLLGGRARLELRPSYTRETNQRYHGLGNASQALDPDVPARDFFTRQHPALLVRARLLLGGPFHLVVGSLYTHSRIAFAPESNLARDLASGSDRVRALLHVDTSHGLHLVEAGLLYDTRDNEIAPEAGQMHSFRVRVSPGGFAALPYRYLQLNLTARAYLSPWPGRLVVAARLVGDLQLGKLPFYELARYDEASALGGANGVRGVPGDRYHGKRKLFGNVEARAALWQFTVGASRYTLGVTGFLDGGRLWADLRSAPELDGTGVGLKYGAGAGLRLRKGETFVLRVDTAWSPDARPLGFYFLAGHLF